MKKTLIVEEKSKDCSVTSSRSSTKRNGIIAINIGNLAQANPNFAAEDADWRMVGI